MVNVYHLDCRSFNPKQELVLMFSGLPTPVKVPCGKGLPLQSFALVGQSCPGTGGGDVLVTQVVNVPCEEVDEEMV